MLFYNIIKNTFTYFHNIIYMLKTYSFYILRWEPSHQDDHIWGSVASKTPGLYCLKTHLWFTTVLEMYFVCVMYNQTRTNIVDSFYFKILLLLNFFYFLWFTMFVYQTLLWSKIFGLKCSKRTLVFFLYYEM